MLAAFLVKIALLKDAKHRKGIAKTWSNPPIIAVVCYEERGATLQ